VPTLLALDTAGDLCSVALLRDGAIDLLRGAPGHNHLEHALPLVQGLLARHGLRPGDCDAFAFGSGPGSFTGLRVACTIVQGLAYGTHRPVVAVGNLDALALAARPAAAAPTGPVRVLAALDARMDQAYWAVYEGAGLQWQALTAPALCAAGELAAQVEHWRPHYCAGQLRWLSAAIGAGAAVRPAQADAAAVVELARQRYAAGLLVAPQQAAPAYVRDDVARTVAQRRAAGLCA